MKINSTSHYTTDDGTYIFDGSATAEHAGERVIAVGLGTTVEATCEGAEAVALGSHCTASATDGGRAIAMNPNTYAEAIGQGSTAISIGGTHAVFQGATGVTQ